MAIALLLGGVTGPARNKWPVEAGLTAVAKLLTGLSRPGAAPWSVERYKADPSKRTIMRALAALAERLEADPAHAGEAVLVYFIGHAEWRHIPTRTEVITGDELSRALQRVAAAQGEKVNLTVVLDCCHAGGILDLDLGMLPSADERLSSRVVVVAAAFDGGRATHALGVPPDLTLGLCSALTFDYPRWESVIAHVRGHVRSYNRVSQPILHGPRQRRPFTLVESRLPRDVFRVDREDVQDPMQRYVLHASPGDSIDPDLDLFDLFDLTTADFEAAQPSKPGRRVAAFPEWMGRYTLDLEATDEQVRVGSQTPVYGYYARRRPRTLGFVQALDGAPDSALEDAIKTANLALQSGGGPIVAYVDAKDHQYLVQEPSQPQIWRHKTDGWQDQAVKQLDRLRRWNALKRWIDDSPKTAARDVDLTIEHGASRFFTSSQLSGKSSWKDVLIRPDDTIRLTVRRTTAPAEFYAAVFRVRADRALTPWTEALAALWELPVTLGITQNGGTRTLMVTAPEDLSPGTYHESLLVVISVKEPFEPYLLRAARRAMRAFSAASSGPRAIARSLASLVESTASSTPPKLIYAVVEVPYQLQIGARG
ncbi:hypothetical protein OV090_12505 [Nannocystis sp. RBIL2]|uniref:hypothetical protein n=1 Tax=Nannocystis sp. RBIL2 TaxID=2996788 RepID=UPI0022702B1C|nr:hypothetical protein [Nannocystis sp. RBIL2]MCY1065593.1 hypothetical protein [Nannocystis sp. RBIL2]